MKKAMTISYEVGEGLYLNLTNKCPCSCTFCLRQNGDGAYGSDPLWLEHEPSFEEITANLGKRDLDSYKQIVFCGYGEPTCALEMLKRVAKWLREHTKTPLRMNTNGLSDLINGRDTAPEFQGLLDAVSISLNAPDKAEYNAVTRPKFGEDSYEAMLKFAGEIKNYVPDVMFTVVDIIGEEKVRRSQEIADSVGIRLRVREYIPD